MVYTPAEDGILLFNFSASPSVTYANRQFADNETEGINRLATEYISGGGYRGHMEVKGGQTYWFRVKGQISMLCSAELIHPQIGATPDFPYQVGPGSDIPFPKEAGKYYYRIANNGNSGYLVISGNDNFNGTATSGTSFDYPTETSTDRIHLRMSVTSGYPSYCLMLDRTEAAGADQLFSAVYSNEPYDQFPGMAINENTPVETAGYPGAYYYRFTVPQDGRTIININPSDRPEASATQTRLFYAKQRLFTIGDRPDNKLRRCGRKRVHCGMECRCLRCAIDLLGNIHCPPKRRLAKQPHRCGGRRKQNTCRKNKIFPLHGNKRLQARHNPRRKLRTGNTGRQHVTRA